MQLELFQADDDNRNAEAEPAPEPTVEPAPNGDAAQSADELARALVRHTRVMVRVTFTDNSSNMMSLKMRRGGLEGHLRIHHMFATAPPHVVEAVGVWLTKRNNKQAGRIIDDYIRENAHRIRQRAPRPTRIRTRGVWHDLRKLHNEVNANQFDNTVTAKISWGRMPTVQRRRSIRLGSYTPDDNLVRIHPLLDQEFVPEFFVRFIVFHEMLHAYVGFEETPSGRRRVHSPRFRRLERSYPDYERAIAWHDNPRNLRRLLRAAAPE